MTRRRVFSTGSTSSNKSPKPLQKLRDAPREAQHRLDQLDADMARLEETSREAWRAYAKQPNGPPPSPDIEGRERIERERRLFAADLQNCLNGVAVAAEMLEPIDREIREIGVRLFELRLAAMVDKSRGFEAQMREAEQAYVAAAVKVDAIRAALFKSRSAAMNANNQRRVGDFDSGDCNSRSDRARRFLADPAERARLTQEYTARLRC